MPRLTRHGEKRLNERVGTHRTDSGKIAKRAYKHGIHHSETTGELKSWLSGKYFLRRTATQMRIFQGFLYVFAEGTLITVYPLPERFADNLEYYVEPAAYEAYSEYLYQREIEKESAATVKKDKIFQQRKTEFHNRVMLEDIRQFAAERYDVDITSVITEGKKITICYIPRGSSIPDMTEIWWHVRMDTYYTSVRLKHVRDLNGKPMYRYRNIPSKDEYECVYSC